MKIKEFLNEYFDTIETILIIGFAAGMVLMLQEMEYSKLVLRISLGALAILYWSKAVERKKEQETKEKLSEKLMWYSLLLTPIALLSKLQFNENANAFLIVSMILLVSAIIFRIYERINSKKKVNMGEISRLFIAIILNFSLFTLPLPTISNL